MMHRLWAQFLTLYLVMHFCHERTEGDYLNLSFSPHLGCYLAFCLLLWGGVL